MLFFIFPLLITFFGLSYSAEASGQENIHFTLTSPKENQIITQDDDTLNLDILGIKSTFQIKHVTATIDKQTTPLQFSNGNYSAKIPLSTLTEGVKKVKITATDVYGNSKSISTNFQYIKQPIHVTSPISTDFYNKTDITIKATAKDFAGPKAKFFVTVDGKTIAAGTKTSINQIVDLSKYNGKAITLKFTIKNTSTGLRYTESHKIYVDDSPLLTKIEKIDGQILEFKYGKLLYKNTKNEIWMKDIQSKANHLVYKNTTDDYSYGYLTKTSLIFLTKSETAGKQNLYQYNDGIVKQLGSTMDHQTVSAAGNYLIWNGSLMEKAASEENHVYFMQLETGNIVSIADTDNPYSVYVNEAGEGYYHTSAGTYRYSHGLSSKISEIGSILAAEGDLFLYETSNPEFSEVFVKWQGGSDQKLNTFSDYYDELIPEYSRPTSILKNGFIAFEKYQNKQFDIYLWNKGEETKISSFNSSTRLASLSEDGMIMTKNNYLLKSQNNYGTKPIKLFNIPMNTYWEGKQAYGIFAGNLVSITTDHTPVTALKTQAKVSLSENKTYQLKAVVTPANATFTKVIWSSSNAKVVTVDSKGKVKGKDIGKATITARSVDGSITASTAITVVDVTPPAAPTINNVTSKSKKITGKAEAGSTVKIYIKGKYIGSTKASANKNFSFKIKPQKAGSMIKAIAVDSSKNKSKAKSIKVKK